jgi:hypothetical protein
MVMDPNFQFEFDKSVSVFSKFLIAPALLVAEVQHLIGKKFPEFHFHLILLINTGEIGSGSGNADDVAVNITVPKRLRMLADSPEPTSLAPGREIRFINL